MLRKKGKQPEAIHLPVPLVFASFWLLTAFACSEKLCKEGNGCHGKSTKHCTHPNQWSYYGRGGGTGGLVCFSPWAHKELDMTEQLNSNDVIPSLTLGIV